MELNVTIRLDSPVALTGFELAEALRRTAGAVASTYGWKTPATATEAVAPRAMPIYAPCGTIVGEWCLEATETTSRLA